MGVLKKNQNTPRPSDLDLLSIPRLWGQKCHSCIDVDVIRGNCTKRFVTKDQPPSTVIVLTLLLIVLIIILILILVLALFMAVY